MKEKRKRFTKNVKYVTVVVIKEKENISQILSTLREMYKSSRSWMFFKIAVLQIFPNIHRKAPVLQTLIKIRLQHSCFPVNIVKFLRTGFL